MADPFTIERADGIATLWLSNPDKRNAMGTRFWDELPATIASLEDDPSVRVVVVAGQGKHFTAGLDLTEMGATLGPALSGGLAYERYALLQTIEKMRRGFDAMVEANTPFIAAVHGACIGGGLDLIAACDLRVATETARFSLRETKIAIVADMGSLQRLGDIVGDGYLRELALTGRDFDAAFAKEIGLLNRVVAEDALMETAMGLAREIASNSPITVRGTKEVLRFTDRHGKDAGLRYVAAWNAAFLASEDLTEAVSAFMQKRPPSFSKD